MEVGRRKEGLRSSGVIAGSVWENRMKIDEVTGGIKVFNNGDDQENSQDQAQTSNAVAAVVGTPRSRLKRGQAGGTVAVNAGKRKTWKSDENPIQIISRGKTESVKNSDEQCKELSVSVDGIKKSPTNQTRRLRSEIGVASDKSPVGVRKPRHELSKSCSDLGKDGDGIEKNSVQLRKVKSESMKGNDASVAGNAVQLRNAKSEPNKASEELGTAAVEVIEKESVVIGDSGSDENCKEFGVCQEMVNIPSAASNADELKSAAETAVDGGGDQGGGDVEGGNELEEEVVDNEEIEVEVVIEIEKKSIDDDIKEVNPPEEKLSNVVDEVKVVKVNEVKKLLDLERREVKKRLLQVQQKPAESLFLKSRKPPSPVPVTKRPAVHRSNVPKYTSSSNEYHNSNSSSFPETHSRLQSLVDLVMWKDISRSVFVFGLGTFMIISSSYTKDINISFISVISYLGLVYLATIFLFKSIIRRGAFEADNNANYVVGEEEAIWVLRLVLPYLNELLVKIKALFSGDPSTTIKLAVLLFALARCGNSITIWTMAKVGFFGVFTVPKVCSLYSAQITVYAKFWVRRFRDAWESCTHKKALTVAVFLLVWNLSSVVARIWAAFVLVVAFRYYQQKMLTEEWAEDEDIAQASEETWQADHVIKQKKGF